MNSKTYLRYEETDHFGVIASHQSNIVTDLSGKQVISAGVQDVLVWSIDTGELQHKFSAKDSHLYDKDVVIREITVVRLGCPSFEVDQEGFKDSRPGFNGTGQSKERYLAAGYAGGEIRVWDYASRKFAFLLNGHRSGVSCLNFSRDCSRLVSGSRDTDVVVWDIVAQTDLFRLRGHKQEVTEARFLSNDSNLVTCSRDMLVKLWSLDTQHCTHTFVGHRSPVWGICINHDESRLLTISSDALLRGLTNEPDPTLQSDPALENCDNVPPFRMMSGSIQRQSTERGGAVMYSQDFRFVGVQSRGRIVEIYRVRTEDEISKKIKRRLKRARAQKKKKEKNTSESDPLTEKTDDENQRQLSDELKLVGVIHADGRLASFAFSKVSKASVDIVVSYNSNRMEIYSLKLDDTEDEVDTGETKSKKRQREAKLKRKRAIELQGHRNDVRAVALSSDNSLLLSVSCGAAKLWNCKTKQCIRTFQSGYSLCCAFVPGDMHALVGTKTGHILLLDLSSGAIVREIAAHESAVWSVDVRPDATGFCSGSADKEIKSWDFELSDAFDAHSSSSVFSQETTDLVASSEGYELDTSKKAKPSSSGQLNIVNTRTLKMSEEVMHVKYTHHRSASRLLLAVALLDCTIKIFFDDSLKFALSLYGHKLPALCLDVSDDNTLIVTGSADKNVKVWGIDFGDCHKSFFAHDDSVMSVRFQPQTHYFFTAGKDNRIRYWDADKFDLILTLEAHIGEVWCLAMATDGAFFVSSGHDKALRFWERTEDIVFPEEERDKQLERKFDEDLLAVKDQEKVGTSAVHAISHQSTGDGVESAVASRRSVETLRAGERLMEAIDIADQSREALKKYIEDLKYATDKATKEELSKLGGKPLIAPPPKDFRMGGREPIAYIMYVLRTIKSPELPQALLLLPFGYAMKLLGFLESFFCELSSESDSTKRRLNAELGSKVTIALLKTHLKQMISTQSLKQSLVRLRDELRSSLVDLHGLVGTNIAAVQALKAQVSDSGF